MIVDGLSLGTGLRVIVSGYIFVLLADEPILYLQRNSFFTVREERKLLDPKKDSRKAIELLYHEVSNSTHSNLTKQKKFCNENW